MPLLSNRPAPTKSGPLDPLEAQARKRVAAGDSERWAFIVPNRVAHRRLERELIEAARGRAVTALNILTLADLAGALAAAALPELKLIGDAESAVLIELSIRELLAEHRLDFFERASDGDARHSAFPIPRGTFELVVNTIRQLKESGVAPPDIERDLVQSERKNGETTEVRRARDIHRIYEAYQSRLADRLMDTYGQMLLVNERYGNSPSLIENDFRAAFPAVSEIFISGFFYLEPPSVALIEQLAKVEGISVTIELEESKDNPELFAGLIDLESKLLSANFVRTGTVATSRNTLSDSVGRYLFRSNEGPIEHSKSEKMQLFRAADAIGEVEEIARRIKLLYNSDASVREDLSRVVVATPSVEAYTPLIQEVFRRHEIPVEIADRYHLDRSPLVLALLALLDLARNGLRKRGLVRVLGSPYFSFGAKDGESLDAGNLLDVISRYRPSGDRAAMVHSLQAQLDKIEMKKEESDDSLEFARQEAEEERIRRSILDIDRISTLLRPFQRELTPAEFCDSVQRLLAELHTSKQLLARSDVTIPAGTLELDTRAYRALTKLLEDIESLFHLMLIAKEQRPLVYYENRLKAALILSRFSPRSLPKAVLVTSLAQSISQPAEYLFMAGLNEGSFPSPYQPQVFLTESLQKGERKQLLEERVLFYQAVTNFKKQIVLSYPAKSMGGGTLNRSSFLGDLEEIVELVPAPKTVGIFSYRDLFLKSRAMQPSFWNRLPSAAPYVHTLHEHVPRASESVRARSRTEDSIYQGSVDLALLTDEERAVLEYNQSRVWSVTQLELYANCPFHYFAREILKLRETEDTEEGLDARDRGSALHEILREFLISRRERKLPALQDIPEQEIGVAYADARAIAERHFEQMSSDHPFWRLDAERLLSDRTPSESPLWKFIKKERELRDVVPRPSFFEVSFGGAGKAPKTPADPLLSRDAPVELGGFKLRGKIDRIDAPEQREDGTFAGDAFTVIDYKSGKQTASWSDIQRGLSLQLPLYLRVAEDLLRSHLPPLKGVAALYHKVLEKDSERKLGIAVKSYAEVAFEKLKGRNGYVESAEELEKIIDATVAKAKVYVDGISAGYFPLTEADLTKQCKHCPYGSVCRVREAEEAGVLRSE